MSDQATEDANANRGDELSYEAARDELIAVVRKLEAGGAALAESMELWERGERLALICQRWLDGARAKVEESRRADQAKTTVER